MSDEMVTLKESFSLDVLIRFEYELRLARAKRIRDSLNLVKKYTSYGRPLLGQLIANVPRHHAQALKSGLTGWDELYTLIRSP